MLASTMADFMTIQAIAVGTIISYALAGGPTIKTHATFL